ncbi:hypothetical protein JCM9533A_41160 [Catenuloplanes niger JCM 9533]
MLGFTVALMPVRVLFLALVMTLIDHSGTGAVLPLIGLLLVADGWLVTGPTVLVLGMLATRVGRISQTHAGFRKLSYRLLLPVTAIGGLVIFTPLYWLPVAVGQFVVAVRGVRIAELGPLQPVLAGQVAGAGGGQGAAG